MAKRVWAGIGILLILFILLNFEHAVKIGGAIGRAFYPVFIGILVALILNTPIKLLEKTILASPKLKKVRRALSLAITLVVVLGMATLAGFLLIPEVIASVKNIIDKLPDLQESGWSEFFGRVMPDFITGNLDKIFSEITTGLKNFLPKALEAFRNTFRTVTDALLGFFMGILLILSKEKMVESLRKLVLYLSNSEKTKKTLAALELATEKFSKFLAGQLFEAVIFGIMCFIAFTIFRLPYAALATVIMALANLIPMVGGYVGGVVSFIFIFSADPSKALLFVIVIVVLQQIEQLTTYPLVVGKYVKLSSFWILFSVVVGGGLFGFWGLVLGVPVVAFAHHFFQVMYDLKINRDKLILTPKP
ncbi:MAG: AI-2E family transporter [Clostridia bacterium]|nr:AI-2E family transporter [Clostridia bacterium]